MVPWCPWTGGLDSLLDRARAAVRKWPLEIWVVGDDSSDQTRRVVAEYGERHPEVHPIRRMGERSLSSAVIAGFGHSWGDVELPYVLCDRRQGVSKITPRVAEQYLGSLWALRRGARERRPSP